MYRHSPIGKLFVRYSQVQTKGKYLELQNCLLYFFSPKIGCGAVDGLICCPLAKVLILF